MVEQVKTALRVRDRGMEDWVERRSGWMTMTNTWHMQVWKLHRESCYFVQLVCVNILRSQKVNVPPALDRSCQGWCHGCSGSSPGTVWYSAQALPCTETGWGWAVALGIPGDCEAKWLRKQPAKGKTWQVSTMRRAGQRSRATLLNPAADGENWPGTLTVFWPCVTQMQMPGVHWRITTMVCFFFSWDRVSM